MSKYQQIYNSINDVVFIHDAISSEILFVNERCQEMYGYTPEEMMASGLARLAANEQDFNLKPAMQLLKKAANGEELTFERQTKR